VLGSYRTRNSSSSEKGSRHDNFLTDLWRVRDNDVSQKSYYEYNNAMKPRQLHPAMWGLEMSENDELCINGYSLVELAQDFGTPLHVVNEPRLKSTIADFNGSAMSAYPGRVSIHYPLKCNSVSAVLEIICEAGLQAEVMTEFELQLALHLGWKGNEIIVNGPCKTDGFLRRCLDANVKYIIIDSLDELESLIKIVEADGGNAAVLLRVNPNYTPRGMSRGSAMASRKQSVFGLDLLGGEVVDAMRRLSFSERIRFRGFHLHIGTAIRDPRDFSSSLNCLPELMEIARDSGQRVQVLDVGGGFAAMTSRQFTPREMLLYEAFGKLPKAPTIEGSATFADLTREISSAVSRHFATDDLPELIYEPGRSLVSSNQLLLLTVHRIKERLGGPKWLIADGGLGTVTLPTYYEYHEIFVCNNPMRSRSEEVTITGPCCFAGDIVYKNLPMPEVHAGEVLAIMDTGAYFNQMESSFGFERPAIVSVSDDGIKLLRRRETFDDMIMRDQSLKKHSREEEVSL
jgi:diaminopimelate decarboxylase